MEKITALPRLEYAAPPVSWPHWKAVFRAMLGPSPYAAYFDHCNHPVEAYGRFEALAGAAEAPVAESWEDACSLSPGWLMGVLPYELKNQFEPILGLPSAAPGSWPQTALFRPGWVAWIDRLRQRVGIEGWHGPLPAPCKPAPFSAPGWSFVSNFTREAYLQTVRNIQDLILDGEFYELNLSQVFGATGELIHPLSAFEALIHHSPTPFAAYIRYGSHYLLAASPERFLQKKGALLVTQPIKGTASRSPQPDQDEARKAALLASEKERAENVMIVDLSRNDLHRVCLPGTVQTPQLFEIQSFRQVHQMVSTVTGQVHPEKQWTEILPAVFPPGSMTGAPKVRAMQWIEKLEGQGRGAYSGCAGYVMPNGDFDWNVVIRAVTYDAETNSAWYQTGGAITADSDPEREYEETLLKGKAIREVMR